MPDVAWPSSQPPESAEVPRRHRPWIKSKRAILCVNRETLSFLRAYEWWNIEQWNTCIDLFGRSWWYSGIQPKAERIGILDFSFANTETWISVWRQALTPPRHKWLALNSHHINVLLQTRSIRSFPIWSKIKNWDESSISVLLTQTWISELRYNLCDKHIVINYFIFVINKAVPCP